LVDFIFWLIWVCVCVVCVVNCISYNSLSPTEDHVIDVKIPPIKLNMGSQMGSSGTVGIVTMT